VQEQGCHGSVVELQLCKPLTFTPWGKTSNIEPSTPVKKNELG